VAVQATREQILAAFERFDKDFRDSPAWLGWEARESNVYAIVHDGKIYPPKRIINLASGQGLDQFNSVTARNLLKRLGFAISELPDRSINLQSNLEKILATYLDAKTQSFGVHDALWEAFGKLANHIKILPPFKENPNLRISWSVGRGNWATIPWLAILDSRETKGTESGTYLVFLFRADCPASI
jgi:5-methylcytosine-specific restriction protein B